MKSHGFRIITNILTSVDELSVKDFNTVMKLLEPFFYDPDSLDINTICQIEEIIGKTFIKIPSKQEWRKIKLEKINKLSKEK